MKAAAAALVGLALLAAVVWPKAKAIGIYSAEGFVRGALSEGKMALSKVDPKPADPRGLPLRPLWSEYRWAGLPHPATARVEVYPARTAASDTGGYGYAGGDLWIDCSHTDSKSSVWSSY